MKRVKNPLIQLAIRYNTLVDSMEIYSLHNDPKSTYSLGTKVLAHNLFIEIRRVN